MTESEAGEILRANCYVVDILDPRSSTEVVRALGLVAGAEPQINDNRVVQVANMTAHVPPEASPYFVSIKVRYNVNND